LPDDTAPEITFVTFLTRSSAFDFRRSGAHPTISPYIY
jgi:hypothetical protein